MKASKAAIGCALERAAFPERWLGEHDVLFLRRDRQEPMVVLPARAWSGVLDVAGMADDTRARLPLVSEI